VYVVVGHGQDEVTSHFGDLSVTWVIQEEQLGTGHAVNCAREFLQDFPGDMLVMFGDAPFLTVDTMKAVVEQHRSVDADATLITCTHADPTGHGRVIRNGLPDRRPARIVEERDATEQELAIKEVNGGMYCFRADRIFPYMQKLGHDNVQNEYYLTEVVEILNRDGGRVTAYECPDPSELANINTPEQLQRAHDMFDDEEEWTDG